MLEAEDKTTEELASRAQEKPAGQEGETLGNGQEHWSYWAGSSRALGNLISLPRSCPQPRHLLLPMYTGGKGQKEGIEGTACSW